jgi:hypothetical protein
MTRGSITENDEAKTRLTLVCEVILVNGQLDALFLNVFISCLYMFRATRAHHQEDQLAFIHYLV